MDTLVARQVTSQKSQHHVSGRKPVKGISATGAEAGTSVVINSGAGNSSVFLRSFAVLNYIARAGRPVLAADIAAHLGLPKPTVYRMIEQFQAEGFLNRQFSSRHVVLGSRLTDFGSEILRGSVQYASRRQIMNNLVAEVGETCNLGALDGSEVVYFDRVEATHWPLRLHFRVGSKVPLHCTAIGKLFLAFLSEEKSKNLINQLELRAFTAATITTVSALEAEMNIIRREGLSVDKEEYFDGVVCLAAPIFNKRHEISVGIAIQAPAARLLVSDVYRYRTALLNAAKALSESLMPPE